MLVAFESFDLKLILLGLAGVAAVLLLTRVPRLSAPLALCAVAGIGVLRRLTGGDTGYTANDPLIVAPALLLVPLLLQRRSLSKSVDPLAASALLLCVVGTALTPLALSQSPTLAVLRSLAFLTVPVLAFIPSYRWRTVESAVMTLLLVRWVGLAAAGYGIYQFVFSPPWDLAWLRSQTEQNGAFGTALPGEFRLFGPTSSPLAFATVLGAALVIWITSSTKLPTMLFALVIIAVPLALTAVRTSVFALLGCLLVVGVGNLKRERVRTYGTLLGCIGFLSLAASLVFPKIVERFALTNLGTDTSFQARSSLLASSTQTIVLSLGSGPGTSQMGSIVVDNGYLAAFTEFGFAGGSLLVLIILTSLVISWRMKSRASRTAFAVILFFAFSETSAPVIQGETGIIFWCAVGLVVVLQENLCRLPPPLAQSFPGHTLGVRTDL